MERESPYGQIGWKTIQGELDYLRNVSSKICLEVDVFFCKFIWFVFLKVVKARPKFIRVAPGEWKKEEETKVSSFGSKHHWDYLKLETEWRNLGFLERYRSALVISVCLTVSLTIVYPLVRIWICTGSGKQIRSFLRPPSMAKSLATSMEMWSFFNRPCCLLEPSTWKVLLALAEIYDTRCTDTVV